MFSLPPNIAQCPRMLRRESSVFTCFKEERSCSRWSNTSLCTASNLSKEKFHFFREIAKTFLEKIHSYFCHKKSFYLEKKSKFYFEKKNMTIRKYQSMYYMCLWWKFVLQSIQQWCNNTNGWTGNGSILTDWTFQHLKRQKCHFSLGHWLVRLHLMRTCLYIY